MDRLPKRFEEEVLSKHMIEWCVLPETGFEMYLTDRHGKLVAISRYELAGIALEAMLKANYILIQDWISLLGKMSFSYFKTIDKAIRELYGK